MPYLVIALLGGLALVVLCEHGGEITLGEQGLTLKVNNPAPTVPQLSA